MKKLLSTFLFTIGYVVISNAQDFNIKHLYPIETDHSYLEFEVTYMGYAKVRGSFGSFYGSIYYDPENPEQTSVTFQIDVESIDTNNDWRDGDLKSGNWFLAEEFPHIRFSSSRVSSVTNGLSVTGDLTIKETTKAITFTIPPPLGVIKDMRDDHQVIFTGSHSLNRKEYGVMGKNWSQVKEGIAALSDDVKITFSLLGKQILEDNYQNFLRRETRPPGAIYAAYKAGGLEGALKRFDELKNENDIGATPLTMVAYMLTKQGKFQDAKSLLERNQKEYPEDGNVYDMLAEVHAELGDLKKTREFYKKAVELDPTNMNATEALKHLN